jgi:predicted amidophosphoribosyltransferase
MPGLPPAGGIALADLAGLMGWPKPGERQRLQPSRSTSDLPLRDALIWRPAIRSRNAVAFHTLRSWRAEVKPAAVTALKRAKLNLDAVLVALMAEELAGAIDKTMAPGGGLTIVPVAPGHSQTYAANLAAAVAHAVAAKLNCPLVEAFEARPVKGVSHPKEFRNLPPLRWRVRPTGPVLLIDDVATSGWHIEEALTLLRQQAAPVMAMAWLGGDIRTDRSSAY